MHTTRKSTGCFAIILFSFSCFSSCFFFKIPSRLFSIRMSSETIDVLSFFDRINKYPYATKENNYGYQE